MLKTPIGRLRAVGMVEGVSYLLLLGVAMPLKYFAGLPVAVKIIGSIHGALFILFCVALLHAMMKAHWSLMRAGIVFVASLIPFGTFVIDGDLRREDQALRGLSSPNDCSYTR